MYMFIYVQIIEYASSRCCVCLPTRGHHIISIGKRIVCVYNIYVLVGFPIRLPMCARAHCVHNNGIGPLRMQTAFYFINEAHNVCVPFEIIIMPGANAPHPMPIYCNAHDGFWA